MNTGYYTEVLVNFVNRPNVPAFVGHEFPKRRVNGRIFWKNVTKWAENGANERIFEQNVLKREAKREDGHKIGENVAKHMKKRQIATK